MPGLRDFYQQNVSKGIDAGVAQQQQQQQQQGALAQLIKGSQLKSDEYGNERNIDMASIQKMQDMGLTQDGGSVKAGGVATGADPYAHLTAKGAQQGKDFNHIAQTAYKPINDQLTASRGTIDALDQNNATSDKLALINEARLSAGGSGSKALMGLVQTLAGKNTAIGSIQDAQNWLNNTAEVTMQPAQRDSIRESVYNRLPQLEQQHTDAATQLGQLGPSTAPMADHQTITKSYVAPAQQNLDRLKASADNYYKQRKGAKNQVSQPATANANPSNLDRLRGFFGGGAPAAPAAPSGGAAMQSGGGFDPDAYLKGR